MHRCSGNNRTKVFAKKRLLELLQTRKAAKIFFDVKCGLCWPALRCLKSSVNHNKLMLMKTIAFSFSFISDSTFLSKIWCTEENYACQIGSSLIVSILKSIGIEIDEQVETDFEFQCMP